MELLTIGIATVALLVALVSFAAQRELFHQITQIRQTLHLDDTARLADVSHLEGAAPSAYGLPSALDAIPSAHILVLSSTCHTCHTIAAQLSGGLPSGLWLLVEERGAPPAGTDDLGGSMTGQYGLRGERVIVDEDARIAGRLGVATTPLLLRVSQGRFADGVVLTSRRQLWTILPDALPIGQ